MNFKTIAMIATASLAMASCQDGNRDVLQPQIANMPLVDEATAAKIDSLYQRMTPAERLAQLQCRYWQDFFDDNKQLDTAACRRLIPNGIGHIPQYATNSTESPQEMRRMILDLQHWLMENTPSGIPALFHEEVLSGFCAKGSTIYPQQIGQACSFNTALAVDKTRQTADVMRQTGGMLSLSPMVDVVKNPYFNRLEESYGEDAYLSAALGAAFVEGLQQGDLRKGVMTTSKHFLGYGGGGDAPEQELYEEILLPHEAMIRTQGSKGIMMGYHAVDDTLCTVNSYLMRHILRDYLAFDGLIVTDYGAMDFDACGDTPAQKAANAINAGMEVEFPNPGNFDNLPRLIADGIVDEATFEQAVKRVLAVKAAMGLLDENPKLYSQEEITYNTPEQRQTAYDIAAQSVVLLKNDGILPLDKPAKIALVGPNANSMWAMTGDYSYPAMKLFWQNVNVGNVDGMISTLLQGMTERLPQGSSLDYTMGCDWTVKTDLDLSSGGDSRAYWLNKNRRIERDEPISVDSALAIAAGSDVIIAAMGENLYLCGENRDRGSLRLPGEQEDFVRQLIATGKPVVLVLFGGRALVIGDIADKCAAIVQAWYPGQEGGYAVADILYGNVNPSAKLSVSYPNVELNEPVCYNTSVTQDPRVQWPFGYGLSYTTYQYSDLKAPATADTGDNAIAPSFTVTNTGDRPGDEIVQLYLSPADDNGRLRPIKLIGFTRVALAPGQTRTVRALVSPQQLGYYADGQWHIDPGQFTLKVAASSQDIRLTAPLTLTGDPITLPLRTTYFTQLTAN